MPKHNDDTIRQAVHWLTDEEYLALKVPRFPSARAEAVANFIVAQPKQWIQTRYIKKGKAGDRNPDEWSTQQYIINFKKDAANTFIQQQNGRWWQERCLLPVDWYYRHAAKGETNIGFLNLSNVFFLDALNGTTGKSLRTYTTGLVPTEQFMQTMVQTHLGMQKDKLGFTVKTISQQELIDQALAAKPKYSRQY